MFDQHRTITKLLRLLVEARRLNNATVRPEAECDALHRAIDGCFDLEDDPSPSDRWDAPARIARRNRGDDLFDRRR